MKNQFLFLGGSTGKTVHDSFDTIFSLSNKKDYEPTNLIVYLLPHLKRFLSPF